MRLAIVGCGLIGGKRAAAATGHEIVVVCDRDAVRAGQLAQKTGARAVADWREAVAADVDAVIVATTHDQLAAIALGAVEAGRHVLVEKPAGRTLAEVRRIAAAAEKHKRIVKAGFNHRFHPAFVKAREIADSGVLGPLMFVRARYGHGGRLGYEKEWRAQPAISGGGELIDQGSHLIDLSRWFLGDLTVDYAAVPTLFWKMDADDNCFMALRSGAGQMAWLHASWTEWKNTFSFEIFGRDGKLVIDGLGGSYGQERLTFYRMLPQMGPPETTVFEYPGQDGSWDAEFADFVSAVNDGRRPCGDIADAVANLTIVEDIYRRFRS
ncbi:MAG: Gfo/Idh/MocA family oxidoreductase [Alphaproteobacteria bacterium]|nr:MAG: Gfo/Idh/MocA family oxidoreductase [Alphaproteobacteria bacterium]